MRYLTRFNIAVSTLCLLWPMVQLNAGTLVQYKNNSGAQYKVHLSPEKVGSTDGFYDLKNNTFVMLDHANKTYSTITQAQVSTMIDASSQIMTQLEGMEAYLPPEYKDALSRAGTTSPAKRAQDVTLKKIDTQKIAGYSCERYQIFEAKQQQGEACIAKASSLNIPEADIESLRTSMDVVKDLISRLPQVSAEQQQQLQLFDEGVPLSMRSADGEAWTLESISTNAGNIEIPSGYKQQEFTLPAM